MILTCTPQANAIIRVNVFGDDAYAPYCFMQNGTFDGIYVRILEKAFSRMKGYEITIIPVPYKRLLLGLENGKIFAAFPPYQWPKERPWIDIYSAPILEEDYSIFCAEGFLDKPRPNWPEDYANLTIGINDGFIVPDADKLKTEDASSNEKNIKKLLAGRIDCYVNDSKSILYTAKIMGIDSSKLVQGIKISTEYGHLAFSRKNNPPFKRNFIKNFNKIIYEMKCSGEINEIVNNFIN
ncbi:ABC transporter substrate-binding protein [Desulfovibrio sp. JC022]|uniref:substrate-binding periplasmic protein n=1 Tax=Desulfovibrio sp. JC022 TaxID=2593642 RepID=UPI0023B21E0F|nr:transporter substrate-binding domain-containing protein [Desulfovibrio sp. JC022]